MNLVKYFKIKFPEKKTRSFTAVEETCAFIWGYPNFKQIIE